VFKGHYYHTLDTKNRISIPAKMRKSISDAANRTVVLTKGFVSKDLGHCIDLYPKNTFALMEESLAKLNPFVQNNARYIRSILFDAEEQQWDGQYRIIIPQPLLEHARIEKEVLVMGFLHKIELWSPKVYREYEAASPEPMEKISESVMQLYGQQS